MSLAQIDELKPSTISDKEYLVEQEEVVGKLLNLKYSSYTISEKCHPALLM